MSDIEEELNNARVFIYKRVICPIWFGFFATMGVIAAINVLDTRRERH